MSDNGVCVIIVNYNAGPYLDDCLEGLASQTRVADQVLLVDNACTDGSSDRAELRFPWLEVLRPGRNLGFAGANNLAVARAQGRRWVALLNPDAVPVPQWLERMLAVAEGQPDDVAALGCRLLRADSTDLVDGDGDVLHVSGASWRRHHGAPARRVDPVAGEIFSPCAAAALYRRDAFLAAGGFDERFFCYLEDVDLGFRLRLLGYRALQVGEPLVHHEGSGITGPMSDFTLYHINRNLVWTFVKNMPASLLWRYLLQHLALNLLGIAALWRRGRGAVVLRAKIDALRGLPAVLRERRLIQSSRVAPIERIDAVLDRGWLAPYRREKRFTA